MSDHARSAARQILESRGRKLFDRSVVEQDGVLYAAVAAEGRSRLAIVGAEGCAAGFEAAEDARSDGRVAYLGALSHANAVRLRELLPFTAPSSLAQRDITFGTGDRLGLAGPGHLRVFRTWRASPVLAQQSVRELTLTNRTYEEVLDSSTWAVFREGFRDGWGADGDHLKTEDWVRRSLAIGYTMITADVSDYIRVEHETRSDAEVLTAWEGLRQDYRRGLEELYLRSPLHLDTGERVTFTEATLARTALVYREAIEHAGRLYRAAVAARGLGAFDFELSVDETTTPTTPGAHLFIAREAERSGIRISSLAPRFVGEFQKGIDYLGDVHAFERGLATHAAIARALGHRVSVHSGSDKFSVFPAIGRLTRGRFHIKTAGTSWLEALRVVATADPAFFRELYAEALAGYPEARKLYHVTPELSRLPDPASLPSAAAAALLDDADARRVLHIGYGRLLGAPGLRERLYALLDSAAPAYEEALERHFGRHMEALGVPRRR
jgi:hypothetical protein